MYLPLKLKKYTYRQVFEMVSSIVGNDYMEVLTLTREEKDKMTEEENKGKRGEDVK